MTPWATKSAHVPGNALVGTPCSFVPSMMPVSSYVSRMAASASARQREAVIKGEPAISFSSTYASRMPATGTDRSCGSTRPPGNTNLFGLNLTRAFRRPISTFGSRPVVSSTMRVAASLGRRRDSAPAGCAALSRATVSSSSSSLARAIAVELKAQPFASRRHRSPLTGSRKASTAERMYRGYRHVDRSQTYASPIGSRSSRL